MIHKIYARPNQNNVVTEIFSDAFQIPEQNDICVAQGSGINYVHISNKYQVVDANMRYNYKLVGNQLVERTEEEKALDISPNTNVKTEVEIVKEAVEENQADVYKLTEQLLNTQAELTAKSQELEKTKSELSKTKSDLTKTKSELESQKSAYQELTDYVLNLDARVTEIENK